MSIDPYYNEYPRIHFDDSNKVLADELYNPSVIAGMTSSSVLSIVAGATSVGIVISDAVSVQEGTWNITEWEKEIDALKNKIQNYNEAFEAINTHYRKLSKLKDIFYSGGLLVIGILYFLSITIF